MRSFIDGLQEYILIAAQSPKGGLRDKPGKSPDNYHTCYNLSGLSAAQHVVTYSNSDAQRLIQDFLTPTPSESFEMIKGINETELEAQHRMAKVYASAMAWNERPHSKRITGKADNELIASHPVFNVTIEKTKRMLNFYYQQPPVISSD